MLDDLWEFYVRYDNGQDHQLGRTEADNYHATLLKRRRLLYAMDEQDSILGYVESWRISFEQFGRILCHEPFSIHQEDIQRGQLCYVANVTIHPDYRRSRVVLALRDRLFEDNFLATHYCGEAMRKSAGLVKVFRADDIASLAKFKEIMNG